MSWQDLLQKDNEVIIIPWTGPTHIRVQNRSFTIKGRLPPEIGWYKFKIIKSKFLNFIEESTPDTSVFQRIITGYLIGNRLIPDNTRVDLNPEITIFQSPIVDLVEPGLDKFVRISAGVYTDEKHLIYDSLQMPFGPEEDVLHALQDGLTSINHIKGVTPALDAAFQMEVWRSAEAKKRREELECQRREEQERLEQEERRLKIIERIGSAEGRRAMAAIDFGEAARAALIVGGAEYIEHQRAYQRGEMTVRFRLARRRFECICDERTLRIIDSGICLTDHDTGEKHDGYLTLESLPSVIQEAINTGQLVVYRHAD